MLGWIQATMQQNTIVDLTTFQILGQNLSNFFVGILVQTMTPQGHFEIN